MKTKDPVIFGNRSLRTVEYTIRMTDDRFQWIQRAADAKGMSVSQFIFEAIDSACIDATNVDVLRDAIKEAIENG